MPRQSDKRKRLIAAARDLIHHQGLHQTTLADIAEASGVPLGNVYYYFKTKEAIASAVIAEHRKRFVDRLLDWEPKPDPRQRLQALLRMVEDSSDMFAAHGCPVGGLCQELNAERSVLVEEANSILRDQVKWAEKQFKAMGRKDAEELATHLISTLQGSFLMAQTLGKADVIPQQLKYLNTWLATL